jgi:hypothetical protein
LDDVDECESLRELKSRLNARLSFRSGLLLEDLLGYRDRGQRSPKISAVRANMDSTVHISSYIKYNNSNMQGQFIYCTGRASRKT